MPSHPYVRAVAHQRKKLSEFPGGLCRQCGRGLLGLNMNSLEAECGQIDYGFYDLQEYDSNYSRLCEWTGSSADYLALVNKNMLLPLDDLYAQYGADIKANVLRFKCKYIEEAKHQLREGRLVLFSVSFCYMR